MIKKNGTLPVKVNENMRGGEGSVKIEAMLAPEEMFNKGRLFSKLTIPPGSSIGFHTHEKEMEAFYVISGQGEYDDNGQTIAIGAGDVLYTPAGGGHAVKNADASADLLIIALIITE